MAVYKCIICGRNTKKHLCIRGQVICMQCEQGILTIKANHPGYDFLRKRIKRLWEPE